MLDLLGTAHPRRLDYRDEIPWMFDVTANLYYTYWGEFFHLAVFDTGEDAHDVGGAYERTHQRYFTAVRGGEAARVLDLATGGGAFAAWMAERTAGEVVGIDISPTQLARARERCRTVARGNLRVIQHDVMKVAGLREGPFDAAVCLDSACYLPDKGTALRGVATRLRRGARLLLVDWCRGEHVSPLQEELLLEPFYQRSGIRTMETVGRYERLFPTAGFRLLDVTDLSSRVRPNWERAYCLANAALATPPTPAQLIRIAASAVRHGPDAIAFLKGQFYATLLARSAADAGALRYVAFLAERV